MKKTIENFLPTFKKIIVESERHCYITRNRDVQKEAIEKIKKLLADITELKKQSISQKDEDSANLLLSADCVANALISELKMYGFLKNGEPSKAWCSLIDAEDLINASLRAYNLPGFNQEGYARKLIYIEHVVFPPQTFTSPSMVWGKTDCSICKQEYGKCMHIAGEAYMGEFCIEIVQEIKQFLSLSLVSHPADKRRVLTSISEGNEGLARDYMTWKIYKDEKFSELQKNKPKDK